MATKEFKVVVISANTNSFGLRSVILMARDGETWQALSNEINLPKTGEVITVPLSLGTMRPYFTGRSWECPRALPPFGPKTVKQVWKT